MLVRFIFFLCSFSVAFSYELCMIAMFRDEAPYLKEWIDYHRLVGIEHFWLYNDHSADRWEEVLRPYIQEGLVDVINWTEGGDTYGYTRQPAIYRDGIENAKGKTTWLAILDIDEFLLPMRDETIIKCLNKHYRKADAIYINWRNFGTGGVTIPDGGSLLSNLTACSLPTHSNNSVGKCIVRPEKVILANIWTPHHYDLASGAIYFNGNGKPMPVENGEVIYSGKHCDKYLRVNHYPLRDEYFYWNFRYVRTGNKDLLEEHRNSFKLMKETTILKFAKQLSS